MTPSIWMTRTNMWNGLIWITLRSYKIFALYVLCLVLAVVLTTTIAVLASSLDHIFLDWTTLWGCLWGLADLADGWVRKGGPIYWIIGMKVTNSGISPQVDRFGAQHVNWLQAWILYLKPQCRALFIKVSLGGEMMASKEHKFLKSSLFIR